MAWNNVPLNGWPQLRGMENLSEALTVLDDVTALKLAVGNEDNGLIKDVDDLQTTVGDNTAGLVKDVDDLQTTVGDNTAGLVKDVDDLQTTVGDNTAGLVKDVNDLQTTVGDNTAGLVKDVNDLQTTVGDNTAGLVKDVNDLDEDVNIKAGDVLSLYVENASFNGYITASATEIYITMPLPKKIKTPLTATIAITGKIYARGVGGFIINYEDAANLDISVKSVDNNLIVLMIKNTDSSAFSATNNTPVSLMFAMISTVLVTFSAPTRDGDTETAADPDVKSEPTEETKTTKRSTKKTNGGE